MCATVRATCKPPEFVLKRLPGILVYDHDKMRCYGYMDTLFDAIPVLRVKSCTFVVPVKTICVICTVVWSVNRDAMHLLPGATPKHFHAKTCTDGADP